MQLATIGGTMAYSDDLIRLGKHEPPPTKTRDRERQEIADQVAEFLARGGAITEHGTQSAVHYPMRRSRKAQVNFMRERGWKMRGIDPNNKAE